MRAADLDALDGAGEGLPAREQNAVAWTEDCAIHSINSLPGVDLTGTSITVFADLSIYIVCLHN